MGSHENARLYYRLSMDFFERDSMKFYLASAMTNLGYSFYLDGVYDSALRYHQNAQILFDSLEYELGTLYCLGNRGLVHARMGQHDLAEENMRTAISRLEEYEDYYAIADFEKELADIYRQRR